MLLLAAVCCVGAVSADEPTYDAAWWNGDASRSVLQSGGTFYIVDNNPTAIINPKSELTLSGNLILDFSKYKGTFADVTDGTGKNGALFGSVDLGTHTLEINHLTMTSVKVTSPTSGTIGGVVGYATNGKLNIADCRIVNCSIGSASYSSQYVGGLVGSTSAVDVTVTNCHALHCNVVSRGSNVGGLIGSASETGSVKFIGCSVVYSTVASSNSNRVGGLVSAVDTIISIDHCNVENAVICASTLYAGGLVGVAGSSVEVSACTVNNCVIVVLTTSTKATRVGGLVGYVTGSIENVVGCVVESSTLTAGETTGGMNIGGLFGQLYVPPDYNDLMNNKVINCAIYSATNSENANYVCGNIPPLETAGVCTVDGDNFINNNSIHDIITPINSWGWNSITKVTAQHSGKSEVTVTDLGQYGEVGGYGVGSAPKITYNDNGATSGGGTISKAYAYGSTVTIAEKGSLEKTGYSFNGWNTQADGTGTEYAVGYSFPITADLTLYVKWAPITYSITYNLDGGTNAPENPATYTIITQTITLADATKEGHTFEGWYIDSLKSDKKNTIETGSSGDKTFYANWTANQYEVTLDKNGGGGGTEKVTVTYEATLPTISSFPTKTGYTFAGYYDAASAGTQYYTADGSSAKNWDKANDATLYAHWTANTTTVTLSQTDATTKGTESITATYDSAMPTISSLPTKTGYTFKGYFDTNTTPTQYYNADGTSKAVWDKDVAKATLYANWTANTYTVHFDANGGTGTMADQTFTYDDAEKALTKNTFTRFGYIFSGWDTNSDGTTVVHTDEKPVKNLIDKGTVTLYAVWTGVEYNVDVIDHVATFETGLPVVKVDVGKNGITKVKFQFKNGKPAVISTNPTGFKNTKTFGDEFDLSIEETQTGDVIVFFTAGNSGHYFLAHYKNNAWEFLKAVATEVAGQYKAVVTKESGFSPFQIVSAEPEDVPQSHSSSRDNGASIWLPATAEPTAAPTEAQPTQAVPTAAPVQPTPAPATPAPFIGLLAGLGAAAVFFGMRRK